MMYIIRGFEHGGISGLHIISGRFAETLGDVHIVPVGEVLRLGPVGGAAVEFVGKLEQFAVACAVVKPKHAPQIVSATRVFPILAQKLVIGNGELVMEIFGHEVRYPFVAGVFVVVLKQP